MKKTGTIKFNSGFVDITDPCYDNDMYWCRLRKELPVGEYKYEANIDDCGDWGKRVTSIRIQRKDWKGHHTTKLIGHIDVDAGLAGFFDNKPDYNRISPEHDEWVDDVCTDFLFKQDGQVYEAHCDNAMRCEGVFAESGYGDGEYPVYEIRSDYTGVIVGYKIKFI